MNLELIYTKGVNHNVNPGTIKDDLRILVIRVSFSIKYLKTLSWDKVIVSICRSPKSKILHSFRWENHLGYAASSVMDKFLINSSDFLSPNRLHLFSFINQTVKKHRYSPFSSFPSILTSKFPLAGPCLTPHSCCVMDARVIAVLNVK